MFVVFDCFEKTEKIGNDLEIDAKAEKQHVSQIGRKTRQSPLNSNCSSTLLRISWQNAAIFPFYVPLLPHKCKYQRLAKEM